MMAGSDREPLRSTSLDPARAPRSRRAALGIGPNVPPTLAPPLQQVMPASGP
jgi:hypothetical protein